MKSHGDAPIEVIRGDLLSMQECSKATEGVEVIYHLAAGIEKTFAGCFLNSVVATRNLLESVRTLQRFKRFVLVSSFAVYSYIGKKRGAVLDEGCELESAFMERYDPQCFAKIKQEEILKQYSEKFNIPFVIVRPGSVYGPASRQRIPPRLGSGTFGIFLNVSPSNQLPLTYIDNCAEAIVLAGVVEGVDGETFNVVDDELPTSKTFLSLYKKNVGRFLSVPVPFRVFYGFCYLWEKYSKWSKGQLPPAFNRRKCASLFKGNRYSNAKLKKLTGWAPRVSLQDGSKRYFEFLKASGEDKCLKSV